MIINKKHYYTIWLKESDPKVVQIIDQRHLPHKFIIEDLKTVKKVATAIRDMHVRGAGLIGAAAGYGMYIATLRANKNSRQDFDKSIYKAAKLLIATRPTAVNLEWAVNRMVRVIVSSSDIDICIKAALEEANKIVNENINNCRQIGEHGVALIKEISHKKNGDVVNILTHCNAGWLAFVDYGSATAPIYKAEELGIKIHVYVDETRPRNQGARLTAYELGENGIPHTIIADNVGGHLMQHGMIDMVIVGSDRTTYTGDVANKIGTYLKAIAASDNLIPFYVALPSSTIDWNIKDGIKQIPIEVRNANEVKYMTGLTKKGKVETVLIAPKESPAINYSFDVTPARLITALITEKGVCGADKNSIAKLYPELSKKKT